MKRSRILKTLSVMALMGFGVVGAVNLSSCNEKTSDLTGDFGGVKADYFDCYLTRTIDGADQLVTTSGDTLLESGTEGVKIHSQDVPEGYKVSYVVQDSKGNETSEVKIAEDGTVTLPEVTGTGAAARNDYVITIIAKDPTEGSTKKIKKSIKLAVVPKGSITTGKQDLMAITTDEATEVFGQAEQLALETGLAGMNFWAYGGYQKISSRVYNSRSENGKFTASTYVPGFGFGYDTYCYLSEDNPKETNASWKRYFHTENSNQPTTSINYFNASGSDVSDMWSYCTSGYFTTLLNDSDNWEYVHSMSRDNEPIPCDENGNELTGEAAKGFHKSWKIRLNTGTTENKVTYRNLGTKNGNAYDGKGVELKDYLTPYILQYTQWVGCKNVTQLLSGNSALEGAADYYASTAKKPDNAVVDINDFLAKVPGIKLNEADNSIIFTLTKGCNSDYAGYRLNNQGVMPLDFVQTILGKGDLQKGMLKIATKDESDGSKPEDNMLSTGRYVLEKMTEDKIVFKSNDSWYLNKDSAGRTINKLAGRVFTLNTALASDTTGTIAYENYKAGYTETSGIPKTILNDAKNEADTIHIENTGDKNGVSFNCLNYTDYQYLFGENGKAYAGGGVWGDVTPGSASKKDYRTSYFADDWTVKPIMSNHNFAKGMNCGYDRDTFAATLGRVGFSDYFGDINKMSPKASQRWNDTDSHKNAVKAVFGETGIPTNSNEKGVGYFKTAIKEELEAGHYVLGTSAQPTVISINVNWQSQMWVDYQGTAIFDAIADTFNSAVKSNSDWCASDGSPLIKLVFDQTYEGSGSSDFINVYAKVALGQYDIAQASLDGGVYEVFQETGFWESYNRSNGLTIHHALVTNIPSSYIYYNGSYWSLDGLFYANQETVELDSNGLIDYDKLNPVA